MDDIFEQLKRVKAPEGLDERIVAAVAREARRRRRVMAARYAGFLTAVAAAALSGRLLAAQLLGSSLPELLDLALSDWRYVIDTFGSWSMAVLEALPVGAIVLVVGAVFAALALLERIIRLTASTDRLFKKA